MVKKIFLVLMGMISLQTLESHVVKTVLWDSPVRYVTQGIPLLMINYSLKNENLNGRDKEDLVYLKSFFSQNNINQAVPLKEISSLLKEYGCRYQLDDNDNDNSVTLFAYLLCSLAGNEVALAKSLTGIGLDPHVKFSFKINDFYRAETVLDILLYQWSMFSSFGSDDCYYLLEAIATLLSVVDISARQQYLYDSLKKFVKQAGPHIVTSLSYKIDGMKELGYDPVCGDGEGARKVRQHLHDVYAQTLSAEEAEKLPGYFFEQLLLKFALEEYGSVSR